MIKNYLKLSKFGIVFLVLLTTLLGYILGPNFSYSVLCFLIAGIYWVSSGSFILNQASEHLLDSQMNRTKNRPIPKGVVSPDAARILGWLSVLLGLFLLMYVNILSVLLAVITILLYNFFYTLRWKKKYPYGAVFFGAIPGAMPVVIGYSANTSSILSIECGYLFLIMFLWQIPHFWSLAFHYKKDYSQAKIPVLPIYFGEDKTFFHIGLYTLSYVGLALLAPLFLNTSFIYLIIALPLCLKILFEYYCFYRQKNWLPFFSWLNISLLVFLSVPFLDQKMISFYLSF
ncbi:MAG: heme o synthase [Bdellovibrionales bacterium]|nr:heme o synthase [Bdellovibrionales bacterium]